MRNVLACTLLSVLLTACGGAGDDVTSASPPAAAPAPAPSPTPAAFAEVDRLAGEAFTAQGLSGMGLVIYDAQGTKRFEKMYGTFAPNQRVAIASASKLVSGLVLLRLVTQGYLSLDSTTASVLGWSGPNGAITLRQLLSFTSGLLPEAPCTLLPNITLADCVEQIATSTAVAAPGTRYDYGSTHLHVAARMAEVIVGQPWATLFETQLKAPLGLGADLQYYTAPRQAIGTINPLIAGGLRATMDEYATLLALAFNRGTHQTNLLIAPALFDAQATEPYPAAVIGNSPFAAIGLPFHYGLTGWLECTPPATNCPIVSSPGAFGWTPWFDRSAGYYAILAMEVTGSNSGVVAFSVNLEQQLKPAIRTALTAP